VIALGHPDNKTQRALTALASAVQHQEHLVPARASAIPNRGSVMPSQFDSDTLEALNASASGLEWLVEPAERDDVATQLHTIRQRSFLPNADVWPKLLALFARYPELWRFFRTERRQAHCGGGNGSGS
jgi:hypothetical protein